ncbi:MAG: class I SAM-dependent methyltransferase [Armatimonadetes bacterium]|nr:class I SAM-dependent methyltransferase [Armatimonadota bacterium]
MSTLDAANSKFREQVQADWATDETAAVWQKHFPKMRKQMANVTSALLKVADPQPGMRALDIAAGTGDPSLSIAKAVAPGGSVVAVDLNPHMLSALRHNAMDEGLANIRTEVADGHDLPFEDHTFDLVTSRWGIMFMEDAQRAIRGMKRVLKPGGRIALAVWGAPVPGTYFGAAVVPFMARIAEKPDPDGPSPMRFAEPGKLARHFEAVGFNSIQEVSESVPGPYEGEPEEMLSDLLEIATPFRKSVESLSNEDREAAVGEAIANLKALSSGGEIHLKVPVIIVSATA